MPSRTSITTAAGAALLTLALLTGCGSAASESAPAAESGQDAGQPEAPSAVTGDRAIVTTGEIGLRTTDVRGTAAAVEDLVAMLDGRIDSRSERNTGGGNESHTADLTVRVPAEDYDSLVERLREVADVEYLSTRVTDVTMETVDLQARIQSLEASVESLRGMLAEATSVDDMLAVEETLSAREAELQSLRAQEAALADQVAMSTLSVTISNDELANPTPDNPGFFEGLQAGWNTLVAIFGGLLTAFGFMLPGLIVLAIIALIVFFGVRAIVRSRRSGDRGPAAAFVGATGAPGGPMNDLDAAGAQSAEAERLAQPTGQQPTGQQGPDRQAPATQQAPAPEPPSAQWPAPDQPSARGPQARDGAREDPDRA
ncbi:hypothetical protein GCM10011490_10280 [Pseudoclavibacter endophyticus]|uniref:DUF4349 domain-containing protein n=1 Tax=Pseudoclavibacter endophyticus TaxID=1778590 RepID=A0A6H9WTD7_9MICO|nr:DUF4349 domain-containing protein [Pseudoclavibacter endophyticus]KAB1649530.1 DUF4349 domain-containing protein [Pseudoclavibacter endophyticus]GGA61880.1 hypothetical protein GCM10011490_10280 [Pseudoclavibacter endophyticus]